MNMNKYMAQAMDAADKGSRMEDLIEDQTNFSRKFFGPDSVRGPYGPLKHLAKEVVIECLGLDKDRFNNFLKKESETILEHKPVELYELADCLILLLDSSRRAGFDFWDLVDAAKAKMVENWTRKWPEFDPNNVNEAVEHIKEN